MATRTKSANSPITEIFINIAICLLSLEYLICIGIRRLITSDKPKYSLGEFLEGKTSGLKLIYEERP